MEDGQNLKRTLLTYFLFSINFVMLWIAQMFVSLSKFVIANYGFNKVIWNVLGDSLYSCFTVSIYTSLLIVVNLCRIFGSEVWSATDLYAHTTKWSMPMELSTLSIRPSIRLSVTKLFPHVWAFVGQFGQETQGQV